MAILAALEHRLRNTRMQLPHWRLGDRPRISHARLRGPVAVASQAVASRGRDPLRCALEPARPPQFRVGATRHIGFAASVTVSSPQLAP